MESKTGLSPSQISFKKGKSMVIAIKKVIACTKRGSQIRKSRGVCVLVTMKVKKAINSASLPKIIEALIKMRTSNYLVEIVKSYPKGKSITGLEPGISVVEHHVRRDPKHLLALQSHFIRIIVTRQKWKLK